MQQKNLVLMNDRNKKIISGMLNNEATRCCTIFPVEMMEIVPRLAFTSISQYLDTTQKQK